MEDDLKALEGLTLKNFSFAHALLPDELMATQLLVDSVARFVRVVETREALYAQSAELFFLSQIYALASIRNQHFRFNAKHFPLRALENPEVKKFYQLEMRERAILFLKEKRGFSLQEIANILSLGVDDIYRHLHGAREAVL